MRKLPLIGMHAMHDIVAWKNGQPIRAAEFIEAAVAQATALPSRRYVLNLCRDRYHFIVGLGAAMIARRVTLLPPGYGEAAMRDIRRDFGDLCCLADHVTRDGLEALARSMSARRYSDELSAR